MTISTIQLAFANALNNVISAIVNYLPNLIAAILILILGTIVANWLKYIIKKLLQAIKLSNIIKNSAIETFIKESQINLKIEEIVSEIIKWIILIVFFIAAINLLGLSAVSLFLTKILSYLPKVFSASLIFLIGVIAAGVVESMVKGAVSNLDRSSARLLGKFTSYTTIIFTTLVAIGELGIAEKYISVLFTGFVATLALGFGLSFGLGAKDLVSEILKRWYQRLRDDINN